MIYHKHMTPVTKTNQPFVLQTFSFFATSVRVPIVTPYISGEHLLNQISSHWLFVYDLI